MAGFELTTEGQATYYGGLTQMTTPTGGVYTYSYRTFVDDYGDASLTLASRNNGYGTWQYSQSATPLSCPQSTSVGCTQTMTTVEPNGRTTVTTNTMNNGAWPTSVLVSDGAGHNLSLATTQWDLSHPDPWLGYGAAYVHKLSETNTIWDSTGAAETSKTAYTYDSPQTGNITVLQQWGYYSGTSPSFPSVPDITTKTLYYAPTNSPIASQAPYPPKGGTNVIDKPSSITVYNGAGSLMSQKLISYDQYAPSQITGVVNHDDQSYGSNQLVRGNPTSVSQWVSGSQYVTTHMTYDTTGQVVSSTDGNGNVTKYDYTDAYYVDNGTSSPSAYAPPTPTHAYATTVTLPTVNGRTFTTKAGYYYGDQKNAFTTDINSNSTYFHYSDPLDRLTQTVYPLGWTLTQYTSPTQTDVYKALSTSSPSSACTGCLHSSTIYDGLQRVVRTTGADGSIVDLAYNSMGLAQSVSNPYQTHSDSTYGLTTYAYDVQGRLCMQNNPDSNVSQTTSCTAKGSSAQQFTYVVNGGYKTDENGNTWKYLYDPLGRLASVSEPSGATTQYTNDVLGNLLSVTQTGLSSNGEIPRLRSFTYDGLSRLVTAINPESGKVCYGIGSSCTGGYDGNGNVISKTDARGVTTNYGYDALNRLTSKTYTGVTGSVAATQPSTYIYDQTTSGGTVPNANGRLVEEYTGSSSPPNTERFILGYDAMGRITQEQQCAVISVCGAAPYSFQYMYDLAGDVTYSTNGVSTTGIGLTYAYDSARRLQTITSTWDDATHPPTLFSPPATGAQYSSVGLISASLGSVNPSQQPDFTLQRAYDKRLRPISETDVATASVLNPATLSSGSITLGGIEQQTSGAGTPATGQIQITGQEGSHQVCTTGPAPVGGKGITRCNTVADTGSLSVSVDGFVATASYGVISSDATLATALATALSASGSPVTAMSSNNVITMTSIATGTTADYPYSVSNGADFSGTDAGAALTGGVSGAIIYDSGSVSVTVNGSTVTVPWQEGSSAQTIASGLLSALQSADGSFLTVNLSGTTLSLTSKQTGTAADWTIATSVVYDSAAFTSASFSAAASGMTGGSNAVDGPTTIYSYSIPTGGYAPNGNLLNLNDSITGGWTYTYDSLNRLTKAQAGANAQTGVAPYGSGLLSWTYDSFGNYEGEALSGNTTISLPQVTHTYTGHSLLNGVAQNGAITNQMDGYNYDASGNLLSDNISSTYSYDAEGRVAAVDGTTQYVYDAEGRRVAKLNGTTPANIYLLGLGGEQLSEINNSTGTMAWAHSNVYAAGGLLATYSPSGLHFHFADWLGTRRVQSLVQTAGSEMIEETCLSLPYGDALTCSGTDATEQHFTGKERDTESGNDYFGARYYGSSMGRMMSPDPSGLYYADPTNPQSFNLYAYVRNNPLNRVDPTGLDCVYIDNDTGQQTGFKSGDCDNSSEKLANSGYYVDGTVNQISYNSQGQVLNYSTSTADGFFDTPGASSGEPRASSVNPYTGAASASGQSVDVNGNQNQSLDLVGASGLNAAAFKNINPNQHMFSAAPTPTKLTSAQIRNFCAAEAMLSAGGTVAAGNDFGTAPSSPSLGTPERNAAPPNTAGPGPEFYGAESRAENYAALAAVAGNAAACYAFVSAAQH